jgi:hypothetical protein
MVANLGGGYFSHKLQVLGDAGNDSSRKDAAIVTNSCAIEYDHMGEYMTIVSYYYIFFYHGKRIDNDILSDLSIGMNNG